MIDFLNDLFLLTESAKVNVCLFSEFYLCFTAFIEGCRGIFPGDLTVFIKPVRISSSLSSSTDELSSSLCMTCFTTLFTEALLFIDL